MASRSGVTGARLDNNLLMGKNRMGTLVQALGGEFAMDADMSPILSLDPDGSGRDVLLPAEQAGLWFIIANTADGDEDLTVKEDSDTTTIAVLGQDDCGLFFCSTNEAGDLEWRVILTSEVSGLTATAAEINRVADVSERLVALSGAESITLAAHDGKTLTMGTTDVNATLPAATGSGARFRFLVTGVPATTSHTIACAGTDEFNGHCIQTDVDTSDTLASYPALVGDDFDLFTMNGTTQGGVVGDVVEVEDVATGVWAIKAIINSSGSVASPFSSS